MANFLDGDIVEIKFPKDPKYATRAGRRRRGPILGVVLSTISPPEYEPGCYWVRIQRMSIGSKARDGDEFEIEDAFDSTELVLHERRRRLPGPEKGS